MNRHSVLSPSIDEDAAKALYDFIQDSNDGIISAHVKGYLHNSKGAVIRLEPIEKLRSNDMKRWNKIAARRGLYVSNVEASLTSGHADLTVEYKPSTKLTMIEWKNLIWPGLLLIALTRYLLPYLKG